MLNVGVIGYGYWGPNIVRNFYTTPGVNVSYICDFNEKARDKARIAYPHTKITADCDELINDKMIDAVAIITPVFTHFELARKALMNGKHIFVEKPFASNSLQADELITLAEKNRRIIMVDHTFIFTGAVRKIKELIDNNTLGDLYYYDSTRVNLGLFQHDINVIWDLAVHDIAIMAFLIDKQPLAVSAVGSSHFGRNLEDIAFLTVYFSDNFIAHFNVNWLSPVKLRMTLIGGSNKMLVWNDLEADEKIKIYDKGIDIKTTEGAYNLLVSYRSGDMQAPRIDHKEALKTEIEYFVECIRKNMTPVNDGHAGRQVVKVLEASTVSLSQSGKLVTL